jgi:small neutral amino acid transporter SnatA (MarC family)
MRAIGLAALLLSVLMFLFPWYHQWVPFIRIATQDTRIVGGLLLAVGAITLAVHRS